MRLSNKIEERFIAGPSPQDILKNNNTKRYFEMLFCSPKASSLFDLWCSEVTASCMPTRKSIDTKKLMLLGANLIVMKKRSAGHWDLTFAGTNIVKMFGEEVTGKDFMSVFKGLDEEGVKDKEDFVRSNHAPYIEVFAMEENRSTYHIVTSLVLPLFNPEKDDYDGCFIYLDKIEMRN